jgi:DNA mismatch repair ATPase MutS
LRSIGLRNFCQYLYDYKESTAFQALENRVKRLRNEFSEIEYCMLIKNGSIRVRKYEGQADHSRQILATFEKFRQGDIKDYRHKLSEAPHAVHVEAAVLNLLAGIYKEIFADLNDFCTNFINFDNEIVLKFSREIQFYLSWLDYVAPLKKVGLHLCYPKMSRNHDHIYNLRGFDLALARIEYVKTVVNDFVLDAPERIIVVTGPNQGGKTTFARQFGQVHYLASLGLCVPGRKASLYLFDGIYTHFGCEEDLSSLNGKLQDDLVRLHELLEQATSRSIVVMNEIFTSTTIADALILGGLMMDQLADLGVLTVLVTFLDELALHGPETVSMMSTVEDDDPSRRTFEIIRKPPDGLAYAQYIATKHGLTYIQLCGRLKK